MESDIFSIPVLAVVAIFVFLLLHLTPGDPATVIAGDYASPADVERIRDRLGLNKPLHIQFFGWTERLLHGDLGTSIFSQLPVSHLIAQRIEPTIALALTTIILLIGNYKNFPEFQITVILALVTALIVGLILMIGASHIVKFIPKQILHATARVMAFILAALATQFVVDGIKASFNI